jgi:hypothetical protein
MYIKLLKLLALLFVITLATGCVTVQPYDYTAFKQSKPRSILVLPPINNSPEVAASYSLLSHITYPLAESGYYVFPVALVDETFKQNGMTTATDIHALPLSKLKGIFGADAVLYITITKYGSTYTVINSVTEVAAEAKLVDAKTGTLLWQGQAYANSDENQNNSGGGLTGLLINAIVKQIVNNVMEVSHQVAGVAGKRLLIARQPNGMLYGPRSPQYGLD